MSSELKET